MTQKEAFEFYAGMLEKIKGYCSQQDKYCRGCAFSLGLPGHCAINSPRHYTLEYAKEQIEREEE